MTLTILKRLAILLVCIGGLVGLGYWLQSYQIQSMTRVVETQATKAEESGDLTRAVELLRERVEVTPDDIDAQKNYADALLKSSKSLANQNEARMIYESIVTKHPGREDARRALLDVDLALGRFDDAQTNATILLQTNPDDGDLLFTLGRCRHELKDVERAITNYQAAIDHKTSKWIEAYSSKAELLADYQQRPEQADAVIEAMVDRARDDFRVYLERGRYRRKHKDQAGARKDLEKAVEMAPKEWSIYAELADLIEEELGRPEALRVVNKALEIEPNAVPLYEKRAVLELREGKIDLAVAGLEAALNKLVDQGRLRIVLATILARRGDTGKLLLQIEELKRLGFPPQYTQYLMGYYYVNMKEFVKARQALLPLISQLANNPNLKSQVNLLLARCYSQLGEPGMQQEAYLRAMSANPNDSMARLGYIANLAAQGDFDGAIQGYRDLLPRIPQVRLPLARLLVTKNLQRPESSRDWSEVDALIEAELKASPDSDLALVLRIDEYAERDRYAEAKRLLDEADRRFPKSANPRLARANLYGKQGQFDAGLAVLEQARKELGDKVDFRIQAARLIGQRKGAGMVQAITALAEDASGFSKDDRHNLLTGLATELLRLQEYEGASRLLERLAVDEPNNMEVLLTLLDLQFQVGDRDRISSLISQIRTLDGEEGILGRYCEVRRMIWLAKRESDANKRESLRTSARELLGELKSRRQDWSFIPLAIAEIDEQTLAQGDIDGATKQRLQEEIVENYLRAIELGQRRSDIVRRAVDLLFALNRGNEALSLFSRIPVGSQIASDLGGTATRIALENRDFQRAEEIARMAVNSNPNSFRERLWLVEVLYASGQQAKAETELRQAVNLSKGDPDRWISLVNFLVATRQLAAAETAAKEARSALSGPRAGIAIAICDELIAMRGYVGDKTKAAPWLDDAKTRLIKARDQAPEDGSLAKRYVEFLLRTGQNTDAETELAALMSRPNAPEISKWARRALALTQASSGDYRKVANALELVSSVAESFEQKDSKPTEVEDLRVLARVLDAQRTPEHRKQAIKVLTRLLELQQAGPEDRYLLARLYDIDDDWNKAREQYRELILRTERSRDVETISRRPLYLAQFASGLLRRRSSDDTEAIKEAETLVEALRGAQSDSLTTLLLEVELDRARKQFDQAAERIQKYASKPNLNPTAAVVLAETAEKLGRAQLAEQIFRANAAADKSPRGKLILAAFLGRQKRAAEALKLCEPLFSDPAFAEVAAMTGIDAMLSPGREADAAQLDQLADALKKALDKASKSPTLLVGLGNLYERKGKYDEAQKYYQQAVELGEKTGISYNNLAWLMALKDGKGKDALGFINQAIALKGPLPDFLDTRGVIYLRSGDSRRAIKDLETAVAADPSAPKLFHLAQAYLEVNNKEKAKESLDAARGKGLAIDGVHDLEKGALRKLMDQLGTSP